MTIKDLITSVKTGTYPDIPRNTEERILFMSSNMISNFSIILGNCLLNDIPEDKANIIYPKRAKLFDDIMLAVNTGNYGRTNRLVAIIDNICRESLDDPDCWPKRREANNICQWAADYFAWTDEVRREFFGESTTESPQGEVPEVPAPSSAEEEQDKEPEAPAPRKPVPVQKPPRRTKP